MILNETKPPLDEALAHFGVKGMRWGQRRAQRAAENDARARVAAEDRAIQDYHDQERYDRRKKQIAVGALAVAGTAATLIILKKNGHLTIPTPSLKSLNENSRAEKDNARKLASDARAAYKNSKFANRTFRPKNVGNPLWTVNPKKAKTAKDFVDAGFGKNGVFNVSNMAKASEKMSTINPNIWDIPMLALMSGR